MPTNIKVATYCKLQALHEAVLSLQPHVMHSVASFLLWKIFKETTQCMSNALEELGTNNKSEAKLISRYGEIADFLHYLLSFLEAGGACRIPNVIVSPLQMMIQEQTPDAKVVVWSDWIPSNYTTHLGLGIELENIVNQIFPEDHWVVKSIPSVLAVLSLPAAERDNILLHSALGHEVGHVLIKHFSDIEEYKKLNEIKFNEKALYKIAQDSLNKVSNFACDADTNSNLWTNQAFQEVKAIATRILVNWLCELLSDAYAIYLLGPAPLLSLYDLAGMPPPSDDHPPGCLRYTVMLECLKISGFIGTNDNELQWLDNELLVIQEVCNQIPFMNNSIFLVVLECLQQHICSIAHYIMNRKIEGVYNQSSGPYTYNQWNSLYVKSPVTTGTRNILIDRILNYVIPDCVDAPGLNIIPASLPAIMNTGWAVYRSEIWWKSFCEGLGLSGLEGQYKARKKLFNLLLKAIESSHLIQQWDKK